MKKSSAVTVRVPPGPVSSTEPPSATSAIGRSAAGSAWASEPPMVPRWRICGSPTRPAAWASSGARSRTSSEAARSACRVVAPMTSSPFSLVIPLSSVSRPMSMSTSGAASRSFIIGSSE